MSERGRGGKRVKTLRIPSVKFLRSVLQLFRSLVELQRRTSTWLNIVIEDRLSRKRRRDDGIWPSAGDFTTPENALPRVKHNIYIAICIYRKPILNSVSARSFLQDDVLSPPPRSLISFLFHFSPLSLLILSLSSLPSFPRSSSTDYLKYLALRVRALKYRQPLVSCVPPFASSFP